MILLNLFYYILLYYYYVFNLPLNYLGIIRGQLAFLLLSVPCSDVDYFDYFPKAKVQFHGNPFIAIHSLGPLAAYPRLRQLCRV